MKIKELKTNKGVQTVLANLTVTESMTKSATPKPYLKMEFEDGDKAIIMVWDTDPKYGEYKALGDSSLVEAQIEYVKTNSAGYDEFKLHGLTKKDRPSLVDCVEIDLLKNELRNIIVNMKSEPLKEVAFTVCQDKALLESLFNAPATEKSAYSFKGGLLAHIVRVSKTAIALGEVYNAWNFNKGGFNETLDTDLLIVCALLHDIGKVKAYTINGETVEKTFEGELLEDSYISAKILRDVLDKCKLSEEQKVLIEHAVTSSKGTLSFGALNTPRTKEANVFHCLERIDSMMGNFEYMQRVSLGNEFQKLHEKQYCLVDFDDM